MPGKNPEGESHYFTYFKKLYESWEKSMTQALELWYKNPLVTNSSERALEKSEELKNYVYDIMERALKTRYHPIKGDVDKIISALDNIEQKLQDLSLKIDSLESKKEGAYEAPAPPPQPKKTKAKSKARSEKQ